MGFRKTATTSFQLTCANSIPNLKSQGYNYPLFHCLDKEERYHIYNHSIPIFSSFASKPKEFHINIRWQIQNIEKVNKNYIKTLKECLRQEGDIIISGEAISLLEEGELNNLINILSDYSNEIIPIACIRSPYEYHCSLIQQKVKGGEHIEFTEFLSQKLCIIKLKEVFKDKIIFVPFFEMCSHQLGPTGYLFDVLGLDTQDIEIINTNKGVSNVFVRVQNQVNKFYPVIVDHKLNPEHKKIKISMGEKFYLTKGELNIIKDKLEDEKKFFKEELGLDFCDKSITTSKDIAFDDVLNSSIDVFIPMKISQPTVDYLTKKALECEKSNHLTMAYELMLLANHGRPNGPLIKKKVIEYKKILT